MGHLTTSTGCSPVPRRPGSFSPNGYKAPLEIVAHVIEAHIDGASRSPVPKPVVATDASNDDQQAGPSQVNEAASCKEVVAVSAGEQFVTGLGRVLTRWVQATPPPCGADKSRKVLPFRSVRTPSVSITAYLGRLHTYFGCSDECYVIALVYIDRLGKLDPTMTVCNLNVHRLLFTAILVAAKFHDDMYYANAYYAKVGGIPLKEVNALEAELLQRLNWTVVVAPNEYQLYHSRVCEATCYDHDLQEDGPGT